MTTKHNQTSRARRRLLALMSFGGVSGAAVTSLPQTWTKPIVDLVVLPAHAQMSPGPSVSLSFTFTPDSGPPIECVAIEMTGATLVATPGSLVSGESATLDIVVTGVTQSAASTVTLNSTFDGSGNALFATGGTPGNLNLCADDANVNSGNAQFTFTITSGTFSGQTLVQNVALVNS